MLNVIYVIKTVLQRYLSNKSSARTMAEGSKIFLPNRALGYVSNHIPLQVRYIKRRKENLITTCVGKSFHTYGISHFSLLSVSGLHPSDITCMSSDTFHIYTACENVIHAWRRGVELKHTYRGHKHPVHLLLPFGAHLLSVDEASCMKVWDVKTEEVFSEMTFSNDYFKITAILHPATYVNKILVGSEQGPLQLWNVKSLKLVYEFKGWDSGVSCLEQAPAVDVAAVGLVSGKIVLHNLKYDETIMEFSQDWGLVTCLSFRTDECPIMASGSVSGHVVLWNLEERRVESQLMSAHDGAVTGLHCLQNEPLMVTSSPDNSLKLWIFDTTDGGPRLLRLREGHSCTPSVVRFHGANGDNILSAAGDSTLRIFNTQTERFNKSLGTASYNRASSKQRRRLEKDLLKMPPITCFTSETTREKEWDNIAAVHQGIPMVTTWSYDKLKMGDLKLLPKRFTRKNRNRDLDQHVSATCLCLTHCGNFVLIGYSSGHVDRFNIQSGLHRDEYGNPRAHKSPVRGIVTDPLYNFVLTAGSDTCLHFWPFKCNGSEPHQELHLDEPPTFLRPHHESSMVAIALEDFSAQILDLETRTIVRKFAGHSAQLTDATFSPDSRWLITSSMDCTIKTWSVPSGCLIDHFQVDAACTSLSLSPTGALLATAHVDFLGVFLWANRTLYAHVSLRALPPCAPAPLVLLPECQSDFEDPEGPLEEEQLDDFSSPEQISGLITLSSLPNSRWQNLLNIDVIKKRNKPLAPPKAPKSAPFFLPTTPSLDFKFTLTSIEKPAPNSKVLTPETFINFSPFAKFLDETIASGDFETVVQRLKGMGPSLIDFEVRLLSPDAGGSVEVMLQFMKCVEFMLRCNKNFELAQTYLALFLKVHGNLVASEKALRDYLPNVQSCHSAAWGRLQDKLFYCLSAVQALKIQK